MSDFVNINIHKAAQIGIRKIPSISISIDTEIPNDLEYDESMHLFRVNAEKIFTALLTTLPGGTLDQLLLLLLENKATAFRVPLNDRNIP
jgi:hypothetical protein